MPTEQGPSRRAIARAAGAALVTLFSSTSVATAAAHGGLDDWTVQTLEAFADTLIPGQRRHVTDWPIAGVVTGAGAVQAGALNTLASEALPLRHFLPDIGALLNARAAKYAVVHLISLPFFRPALVGLPFVHRANLIHELVQSDGPDREIWQALSLIVGLAFDTAAYLPTADAAADRHPGLALLGFPPPGPGGTWSYSAYSYGRALAPLHPNTTSSGSPA
ncbi:DUF5987 family protein [Streptomyces sp. NPDC015127]|uniref:DUF5987 family protein n=1 Tax=Streptomyces sp. NPDC015127 TaxID=3364939 RepID=UPI0036FC7FD3